MKKYLFYGLIVVVLLIISSCNRESEKKLYKVVGTVQGSYYALTFYAVDTVGLLKGIDSIFTNVDNTLSLYNKNSLVNFINLNKRGKINEMLKEIVIISNEISNKTGGAFNYTVGKLVKMWGFYNGKREKIDTSYIRELVNHLKIENVILNKEELIITDTLIDLDFNAITQGYTADLVASYLLKKGITDFLVDIGGEIVARGRKINNELWQIGIERPAEDSLSERVVQKVISLENKAIATSGNYRKFFIENGLKFSHTIDPKTGFPVRHHLHSVTVIADNATKADAYATAFMVMGKDSAMNFIKNHPELKLEAFFIFTDKNNIYQTIQTSGFPN